MLSYHYGLPWSDLMRMPMAAIRAYAERLPRRMDETRMMLADAASVPHMKEPRRWWREVEGRRRTADGGGKVAPVEVLRGAGISV